MLPSTGIVGPVASAQPKPRAPRRSSAEIRRLLLEAAQALFERQGYQLTTTAQIIERAGVDAPTLYRHFASKAELFEVAILSALRDFLDQHFAHWRSVPPGTEDVEALTRRFVVGFFDALESHKESFRLLVSATHEEGVLGDLARSISRQFTEGLVAMSEAVLGEAEAQGYRGIKSPDSTTAASLGMVLSVVLFGDWVFPPGERPSREEQIDELVAMMMHGYMHRPG
ncbi:hypothetical protein GCM10023321_05990 [Pseudonocardia eucalypti]|uniref:HTH tetR-type domain-containing protein n=1 Tax=Pseudonocardia eucalypti TaxID=648755 RepID=A0ABP9PKP6_9PSEU|nr:AcrR family transcriptional regulator [Pseudonocardia eucalypti]